MSNIWYNYRCCAPRKKNMQWYRRGHNEHDWKSCCRQKRHEGSNPSHCARKSPGNVRFPGLFIFPATGLCFPIYSHVLISVLTRTVQMLLMPAASSRPSPRAFGNAAAAGGKKPPAFAGGSLCKDVCQVIQPGGTGDDHHVVAVLNGGHAAGNDGVQIPDDGGHQQSLPQ